MHIKSDSSDAVAAFLAKGNKITDCGSTMKQARSLKAMRRDDERNMVNGRDLEVIERETYARTKAAGFSESDAMSEAFDSVRDR